jgi:hypothetical protein
MWPAKNKYILLFIGHVIVFSLVIFTQGVNISNEGEKFVGEAKMVIGSDADQIIKYQLLNLSYIIYLIPFLAMGVPLKIVVFVTHGITLFSYWKFSSFIKERYNETVSFWWLAFMMLCPLIVYWNCCLYSESFFIALSLLFISSLFKDGKMTFIFGILLLFARPAGILTIVCALMLKYVCKEKLSLKRSLLFLSTTLLVLFSVVFFFVELHSSGVTREIVSGSVICGFPSHSISNCIPLNFTLAKAYYFYTGQYGVADLLGIWMRRAFSFFNLTRPYYSSIHNFIGILFSVFFLTNALTFILSFRKIKKSFAEIFYIQILIALNCFLVVLFFNEWNDRYTIVVYPFLFFTTAIYIDHLKSRKTPAI